MLTPGIYVHHFQSGNIEIHIPHSMSSEFKELVQRATNLWPDASPAIKTFADQITNDGKLMQDYTKATVTHQSQPKHQP